MIDTRWGTRRIGMAPPVGESSGGGMRARLAKLVLAWATGMPSHAVVHLLPHDGEQTTPYLGV